jgi:CHAT domain-containing protein
MEDTAATRSALLDMARHEELQRYRLLHLACHAQLVSAHGLLAHLKLWDDDLLLDEVGSLGLSGALVVLVACDAAASEVLPGEELLGLSRAFLAAGARDVIASLWPIYDRAIQWLLAPLYDGLAQGQDAPTALAQAQRVMLKQQESGREIAPAAASPIIWGSLSVLGAGTAPGPAAGGTRPASLHAGQTGID